MIRDYSILALVWVCIATSLSLLALFYKPAEDGPPPFPVRGRRLYVAFSDGHMTTLPA